MRYSQELTLSILNVALDLNDFQVFFLKLYQTAGSQ